MRMPWGKHKGKYLDEIDAGYLWWVLEHSDSRDAWLKSEIKMELVRRLKAHFEEPRPSRSRSVKIPEKLMEASRAIVKAGYRQLLMKYHPDHGGDKEKTIKLNDAHKALMELLDG